jgi:hypothetical protein
MHAGQLLSSACETPVANERCGAAIVHRRASLEPLDGGRIPRQLGERGSALRSLEVQQSARVRRLRLACQLVQGVLRGERPSRQTEFVDRAKCRSHPGIRLLHPPVDARDGAGEVSPRAARLVVLRFVRACQAAQPERAATS